MGMLDKLQDAVMEKLLNKIVDSKRIEIGIDFKPKGGIIGEQGETPLERIVNSNDIKLSVDFVDKTKEK
jgi:hypothetical protein